MIGKLNLASINIKDREKALVLLQVWKSSFIGALFKVASQIGLNVDDQLSFAVLESFLVTESLSSK